MKNKLAVLLLIPLFTGCAQTAYQRSVAITRDADGHIVSTTETEGVIQPPNNSNASLPIKFKYLRKWWATDSNLSEPTGLNPVP